MANLADLTIGIGVDTAGMDSDFDKVPRMAEDATDEVESKFKQLSPKLAAAGKAAGLAAGGAIVAGALIGMEREAAGDKLAAQLNLSPDESKQAGSIAGSLYADAYGESLGEVNEAVGSVVQGLGIDLADTTAIEGATTKALDLAAAFDIDVTEAVSQAGILMKTGLAADADEAFDLMTAGLQEVPKSIRDELGEATTEYSKFFGDLGISGEEMFALLSSSEDRFALDKAGDAIKELSIRATDMSTASVEAFEAAGLDAEKMAGMILEGGDTAREGFDQIVEGLLGIEDPTARANAAIGLFGTPLEDLGTGEIPDFLESLQSMGDGMGDVEGRAETMGDTLNDNAKTKIDGAKRSVEGFLARIVEAPGALGAMTTGVAGMGAAMEPVAPAITGLAVVFQGQIGKIVSSMGTFIATYAKLAVASLVSAAKVAASWVIAMGPVGWVIAGVVALVALIVANWDTVKKWTKAAWEFVSEKVADAWDWIKTKTAEAVAAVVEFFGDLRDGAIEKATALVDWVKDLPGMILSALGDVGSMLFDAGKGILSGLWDGMKDAWNGVGDWVGGLGSKIADLKGPLQADKKLLVKEGEAIMGGLGKGLMSGWTENERLVAGMSSSLRGAFSGRVNVPGVSGAGMSMAGGHSESYSPTIRFELPSGDTRTNAQYAALTLANRNLVRGGLRGGAK